MCQERFEIPLLQSELASCTVPPEQFHVYNRATVIPRLILFQRSTEVLSYFRKYESTKVLSKVLSYSLLPEVRLFIMYESTFVPPKVRKYVYFYDSTIYLLRRYFRTKVQYNYVRNKVLPEVPSFEGKLSTYFRKLQAGPTYNRTVHCLSLYEGTKVYYRNRIVRHQSCYLRSLRYNQISLAKSTKFVCVYGINRKKRTFVRAHAPSLRELI